jgi:hypothetical protein
MKRGVYQDYVVSGDSVNITLGNDVDYPDIKDKTFVLIDKKTEFNGSNYVDTGISLFDEDRDFVLAIDYVVSSNSTKDGVIAQCFSDNGQRGFKVQYDSTVKLGWNSNSGQVITAQANRREMLVIRHIKGDTNLYVYGSNAENDTVVITETIMENILDVNHDKTLVLGSAKSTDGHYIRNIVGTIYWSKLWYIDLGETICKELAAYPHESFNLVVANNTKTYDDRRFLLADNPDEYSSITFVADKPLWNPLKSVSTGYYDGWKESEMNKYLNNKVYNGFPIQWRLLLKKVIVNSLTKKSTEIIV